MFIMANSSKEEITIDNFDLEISEQDFQELTSITKEEFHKLRDGFDYQENGERKKFQGVFNKYRFNASIAEFKSKKEQLADYFTAEEDIFELIPNQKTNQIFTPKKVVQMMVDSLEDRDPSIFTRTDTTFIDLYMKSGMYITEIVKKLFKNTRKKYRSDKNCLKHIFENQVYGLAPTPILQGITQSYIFGFDTDREISRKNFIQHDLTPNKLEDLTKGKLHKLLSIDENMKFDTVIGNPPYQDKGGSGGNNDAPIFQHFSRIATSLSTNYASLIIPARWFAAGRENLLGDFRKDMLNSGLIEKLQVFSDSSTLFPDVEIKGGVCIYLENKNHNSTQCLYELIQNGRSQRSNIQLNAFDILIREPILAGIVAKVDKKRKKSNLVTVDTIISSDTPFGIPSNPKSSKKTPFKVYDTISTEHDILLFHIEKLVRKVEYVKRSDIRKNVNAIDKYKVFITGSGGSGNDSKVMGYPELAPPNSVCSQSYLYSAFKTKKEAEDFMKYIRTKFFRAIVSAIKITQSAPSKTYKFVPLEILGEDSNINWDKSISNIDKELYEKYELSKDEIEYIENKITYL